MIRSISRNRTGWRVLGVATLLAALPFAAAVSADQGEAAAAETAAADTETAAENAPTTAPSTVSFSGMMVQIDPETGRLRPPTPEEAELLSKALARRLGVQSLSAAARTEQHLANGAVMMELDPSLHEYSLVRRAEDGTLVTHCVHGAHSATELVETPLEATSAVEEK